MVEPVNSSFGKMLLEEVSPVVMVLCTPLVEETFLKNGLSFVETLKPFCNFRNIDVPVRTSSDQLYRLKKFTLRLFYASDIRQPNVEVAKQRLEHVITQAGEKDFQDLKFDPPQITDILSNPESEIAPSWFQYYNKELIRTLSFSDHEAFDHPVACLLVVSSKDEEPINKFVDLFNSNRLPTDGTMDPNILKHYLLVHDNQDATTERTSKVLSEMRSQFGSNECNLLCTNSSKEGNVDHQANPWASFKSSVSADKLGCALTGDDIVEIKDLMQEFASRHIIPYMEQKVRELNQQISATRKGFRNQIKNLWWRKGKGDGPDVTKGSMYTYSSTESQIRILGDYAFMLHDYELALSSYRLILTDYDIDKAWKHYAGVQEMMGLAYFISDQSKKESEYCMERAFSTYMKLGKSGFQNALRCGLWWAEMLKARDQHKEAASVYFRICGEEPLHAAVMLEQASYCFVLTKPAMLHKYGFHLVLSGDHYKNCDQVNHAIRTYKSAISVYKSTTWSHIKDHIYFHIGQWYAIVGMHDVAVRNMLKVLDCGYQSKATQEIFLRDFFDIVKKTGMKHEVVGLKLPVINMSSLQVIYEDHRTYASQASALVEESIWQSLEDDIIPSLNSGKSNWLELQSKLLPKKYKESNVCVAGESVKVDLEFKNPLLISTSITSVSLICELTTNSDDLKLVDNEPSSSSLGPEISTEHNQVTTSGFSSFTLSEVDFTLGGGEKNLVRLTVTPSEEGILKIVGVRWELSGSIVGVHYFQSVPVKAKTARGRRKNKLTPTDALKFLVIKSLPRLEGSIDHLPEKLYAGDLRYLVLELRNKSESPIKNLKMKISHPRFLSPGNHEEELTTEFPDCLKKGDEQNIVQHETNRTSSVFAFPKDVSLQGDRSLRWPLWLRAAIPGTISLYYTIYYEMENVSSIMKYRTLRMHYTLQVLPSLQTSFEITPSPSRLQEFLVRMDIVNRANSGCFQIHQLSTVGCRWGISLLQPVDTILPSKSLLAGQALSCFFMIKDCRKSGTEDEEIMSLPPSQTDVKLFTQDDDEKLFDIVSSPLASFHDSERSCQGPSVQVSPNTVDFILISRLAKSSSPSVVPDLPKILTHHSCHNSIRSSSPLSWSLDGPQTIHHDFLTSLCEIKLKMVIRNTSEGLSSVTINTNDCLPDAAAPTSSSGNQSGWRYVPTVTEEMKLTSDVMGSRLGKPPSSMESSPPFIWSGLSSTKVQIQPLSTTEIPLQISVFSPGIYDLSSYKLNWELSEHESATSSGTCQGYPYYLTVLQSE
ncbi:trafficking protein particle complex subunit 8 isoform X1 [Arabidopsis lyrata subsp. lyrata]|uniref:trafficking protein particle complex subunit 8 isoform X1 n=1 Tax=Arabidopsis lyrata subsp. lyrata TaxID=81972 RepID=UPI000A29C921|nr:trafficking protein particle complex subunit 8 isoform X1 [Arabidopsis lyrata subsp. lyrata]|eukprot:XP_020877887.1 trafficking protein particle complex subunit 8 isoform X1 [Arabidopsis lyrata subsp. lyrata]